MADSTDRIAVLGIGSVLMGDDAAGPYTVRCLESAFEFPPGVTVADIGTPGPELSHYLLEHDVVIVVDAVRVPGKSPGSVVRLDREELLAVAPGVRVSPHDPSLRDALLTISVIGDGPREVILVGIVPDEVALGTGLTPPVRRAVREALRQVRAELARHGVVPERRHGAVRPDIWWENDDAAAVARLRGLVDA